MYGPCRLVILVSEASGLLGGRSRIHPEPNQPLVSVYACFSDFGAMLLRLVFCIS